MQIVSFQFAAFVLIVLAAYHTLPQAARRYWLLLASYAFYCLESWRFTPVLAGLTLANYVLAGRLSRGGGHRAAWLWLGLVLNLGALAILRYEFRADPFAGPFAVVGLSFYALQAMSYLLDTHAGTLKQRGTLTDVALYLAYFPKLTAGPIERARTFLPQLAGLRVVDEQTIARAGTLIAIGVTRKLVIADPLRALLPADAFAMPSPQSAAVLAAAIAGYAFVLYNDFAGYTNIARGVSSLFGIELSANFAQPFFARSFTEFWNRWHITLSHWLRDYIYLPVSRALLRRNPSTWNPANLVLPPLLTMVAGGLWHGSGLHMILWGAIHGVYLVGERVVALRRKPDRTLAQPLWRQVASGLVIFVLGCWALVAFRVDTAAAIEWWSAMLRGAGGEMPEARMLWYIALSFWIDWMEHRHGTETAFDHWPRLGRAALLAGALLLWFVMTRVQPPAPFIYRGF